jgi:NADH:ubiquinone oxidoreductase subunit E
MTTEIKICMGSACFAKGNLDNLEYIKNYISENGLEADISIVGALCENKCDIGPRVIINEKEYTNVTQEQLYEILESYKKIMNLDK